MPTIMRLPAQMSIQNGEVTLGRSDELMNVGDTHCQSDPQDCFGLMVGSTVHSEYQAELNVGNTQQTFVHSLTELKGVFEYRRRRQCYRKPGRFFRLDSG